MDKPDTVSAETLHERLENGENIVIIDVREPDEYRSVHAVDAVALPLASVSTEAVGALLGQDATPCFICHSGRRATEACQRVLNAYPASLVIEGGTLAWAQAGLPIRSGDAP